MTRILVIEDDPSIRMGLEDTLTAKGYGVEAVGRGVEGAERASSGKFDLIVLDVMLPDIDGFEVCRRVRSHSNVPVLFLTARDGEIDRILGLELGADDYVTKPFSPREIVARVKAILRRGQPDARDDHDVIHIGDDYLVDITRRETQCNGEVVALATREFDLIVHLARNQGIALSRQQLLDSVWGADWIGDDRTVDVHVRQLRKKLGDDLPLATVWGIGYRLG